MRLGKLPLAFAAKLFVVIPLFALWALAPRAAVGQAEGLADDLDKLKTWGKLFANPQFQFANRLDDALAAAGYLEQIEAEVAAIEQRWPKLLERNNRERDARNLKAAKSYFDRSFPPFKQYVANLKESLPDKMRGHWAQIESMMQTAVDKKLPAYFTGGIPQQVGEAERSMKIFRSIDPAVAEPFAAELDALNKRIAAAQLSLSESIVQNNQVPRPQYAGPDIAELDALARTAWTKKNPETPILKIVFNTPGWSRVTRWQWSQGYKAWEKVDYSKIQPKVIVAHDERLAAVYPVDIYKDHMKGDRLRAAPWPKEEKPDVRMLLLLERVR
jgi:hypothetical protein